MYTQKMGSNPHSNSIQTFESSEHPLVLVCEFLVYAKMVGEGLVNLTSQTLEVGKAWERG